MADTPRPHHASPSADGPRFGNPLDGRLDLDDLDRPHDLDLLGQDASPLVSERLSAWLEERGINPFLRRHRRLVIATTAAVVVTLAASGLWWVSRPPPLPDRPLLLIKAIGPDSSQVALDLSGRGTVTGLTVAIAVASVERLGVSVELISVTGPGLSSAPGVPATVVDTSKADEHVTASASVDCSTPAATSDVLGATDSDYGIDVRRTAPGGEVRIDRVPLVGAHRLREVLHQTCLQVAADRDLSLVSVTATPVRDVAAVDLVVGVGTTSTGAWQGLQVSRLGGPQIVGDGPSTTVSPGEHAYLDVRLWPQDCAHPTDMLANGLLLYASPLGVDDTGLSVADTTFRLPLNSSEIAVVAAAFAGPCGNDHPRATVEHAVIWQGLGGTSPGSIELTVALDAPGTFLVELDDAADTEFGRLIPAATPVHIESGRGTAHLAWDLPSCASLQTGGRPQLAIHVVLFDSDVRRPYLLTLDGARLSAAVSRLCDGAPTATSNSATQATP